MLFGGLPFIPDAKTGDYAGSIAKLEFDIPKDRKFRGVSPQAGELIKRLLVPEAQRASIEEIESHPWYRKTNFSNNDEDMSSASGQASGEEESKAAE